MKPLEADPATNPSIQILLSVARRPPNNTPVESLAEITRLYAGDDLADYLAIPKAPTSKRLRIRFAIAGQNALSLFGRLYPRHGWKQERAALTLSAINSIIQWQLGYRRTRFAAKSELDNAHHEDEYEASTALFGLNVAKQMKFRWRMLLLEVFAVGTSCILLAALGFSHLASFSARWDCVIR